MPQAQAEGLDTCRDPLSWLDGRAVDFNDLFRFDPATNTWTELIPSGRVLPPATAQMGFTATPDGRLYLFGGTVADIGECLVCAVTARGLRLNQ